MGAGRGSRDKEQDLLLTANWMSEMSESLVHVFTVSIHLSLSRKGAAGLSSSSQRGQVLATCTRLCLCLTGLQHGGLLP